MSQTHPLVTGMSTILNRIIFLLRFSITRLIFCRQSDVSIISKPIPQRLESERTIKWA